MSEDPQLKAQRIYGTTDTGGDATAYAETSTLGWLVSVEWVDGDLADGVDAVLSVTNRHSGVDKTLLTLTDANADATYYPRATEHDNTGTALTTTTLMLIDGLLKLVISSGGATKTGGVVVYYHAR